MGSGRTVSPNEGPSAEFVPAIWAAGGARSRSSPHGAGGFPGREAVHAASSMKPPDCRCHRSA